MKKYLIVTSILLLIALLATVIVYWLVSTKIPRDIPVDEATSSLAKNDDI